MTSVVEPVVEPNATPVVATSLLLVRHSGASPDALEPLVLRRTMERLDAADALERRAASVRERLEQALYRLVPAVDGDRALRRVVLELKRDVHNDRTPRLTAQQITAVRARLDVAAGDLEAWLDGVAARDRELAAAEAELGAELADATRAVAAALREPELRAGLALARPLLARELGASFVAAPESRFGRACTAYLIRAAVRTSPFSTLTTLGVADGRAREREQLALENPALALFLLHACARDRELAPAFRFEANCSTRLIGGVPFAIVPVYHHSDGFLFREEEAVDISLYARRLQRAAAQGRVTWEELVSLLDGDAALARRLVRVGLVRAVAPWARHERRPLTRLAAALRDAGPAGVDVAAEVETLARCGDGFAEAGADERLARAESGRRQLRALATRLQARPPWSGDGIAIYHEEVAETVDAAVLPESVGAELVRLGELARPWLVRSSLYERMTEDFVARYGEGGVCRDALEFVLSFALRPDLVQQLGASFERDLATVAAGASPPVPVLGPSVATPALSVLFQVAARSAEAVADGEFLFVPNLYGGPTGGLGARFSAFPRRGPELARRVRAWTRSLFPEAEVYELAVAADWSSLQRGAGPALPALVWPAETPLAARPGDLRIEEVSLTHDPGTDSLTLRAPDGHPVAFAYLGTVPHYLVTGPVRLLLTLSDPWVNCHRIGWARRPFEAPAAVPEGVDHSPRETSGRIVIRRARWRVDPAEFPVPCTGESRLAFLRRARGWRDAHGISNEVFVSAERRSNRRKLLTKPVWLDFGSPHALALVAAMVAEDCRALQLVEALPSRDEHWVRDGAGRRRAVEYLGLVRCPRPGGGA